MAKQTQLSSVTAESLLVTKIDLECARDHAFVTARQYQPRTHKPILIDERLVTEYPNTPALLRVCREATARYAEVMRSTLALETYINFDIDTIAMTHSSYYCPSKFISACLTAPSAASIQHLALSSSAYWELVHFAYMRAFDSKQVSLLLPALRTMVVKQRHWDLVTKERALTAKEKRVPEIWAMRKREWLLRVTLTGRKFEHRWVWKRSV